MPSSRPIGVLLLGLSLIYLAFFVPRGWVPHDEGMLGQSAERVVLGGVPHVDYEETYTGGLTLMHAAIFRLVGVDLLYLRWLLFAGASLALVVMYSLLRDYLSPISAALAAWVGLAWSFPNFFAGMPSWWILICGLCCLWGFARYVETERLTYAAVAGLSAGMAILVKQTGLYLLVALVISLLYEGGQGVPRAVRVSAAIASGALALAILSSRLALAEMLYLLLPIAACSRVLVTAEGRRSGTAAAAVAITAAAAPLALFVAPYVFHGQVMSLLNGLLVLPRVRLTVATMEMPSAFLILSGIPLIALLMPFPQLMKPSASRDRLFRIASWAAALVLSVTSLYSMLTYQLVWESARAFAALLPLAICWLLISGHVHDANQRRIMFGCASMLAWASLVQFPFGAPIYFCFVTPFAVIAAVAVAVNSSVLRRPALMPWAALLLMFGGLSLNRGYVYNLGYRNTPQALNVELNLSRAHLRVGAADALMFQRVVALIESHIGRGGLAAGPDSPEVYFLAGQVNPSATLFEFLSGEALDWSGAEVIVLNHLPPFSPGFSTPRLVDVRRAFPNGEMVGRFEVRWR
jgi:hypothetical protein